jgi:hypothetical protein
MFQNFNSFAHQQQVFAHPVVKELPVRLEMPAGSQGQTIPASMVMKELLWQQYGLDLLHPEVSRWLKRNAPDVKHATAKNQLAGGDGGDRARFKVGSNGTIEVHLSLKVDDRLREVSSQYLLEHVGSFV